MYNHIDINVDVGEGIGNESQLMPFISSCNIACGGHAGDFETMTHVVQLAKKHNVKIGAHPSFPDRENFGRAVVEMPCVALYTAIKNQIKGLVSVLEDAHLQLHHVKLHGALYNLAAVDEKTANVIIEVMKGLMLRAKLYVPYKSVIAELAIENNIPIMYEAFADRHYNDDLTLVARSEKNAIIDNSDSMFEHVYTLISTGKIRTISNNLQSLKAETFCVHGDHPNAVTLITDLAARLDSKGIKIR